MTPWTTACQASLFFTILQSLLELMTIELVMQSNHLILCCLLLLLPLIFPSIRVFSNGSSLCIRWPKYWSFSISPSNEYSGLISFNIDWFDLLAVQGTLRSLLQHQNVKTSILQVQLSQSYMTTGYRSVIAFLPWSKRFKFYGSNHHLQWCLEPKKIKAVTVSTFSLFAMRWWHWMPWS